LKSVILDMEDLVLAMEAVHQVYVSDTFVEHVVDLLAGRNRGLDIRQRASHDHRHDRVPRHLVARQANTSRLAHRVGRLDGGHKPPRFDHSEGLDCHRLAVTFREREFVAATAVAA